MKQSVYALLVGSAAAQPKYIYQGKESLILDELVPQPKLIAATYDSVCASADLKTANTALTASIAVLDTKKGDTTGNLKALQKLVATALTEKNSAVDKVTAADLKDRLTLLEADDGNLKVLNLLKAKYVAEHAYSANLELTNDNTNTRIVLDSGTNVGKDPITTATAANFKGTLFIANETAQAALSAAAAVRGATASETSQTTRYGASNFAQIHLGKVDPALSTSGNTKNNYIAQYTANTSAIASLASTANVDFSETALLTAADTAVQTAWTNYRGVFNTACEVTDLNAAGAATVTISTEYGGTGTTVASIKVTPASAVITLNSTKKMMDVATSPSCCVQSAGDATKCNVATTPYLGLLNKWEINATTAGSNESVGYGTGLKGATDSANLLTIDPTFLTDAAERTYRLSAYKTAPGGSLTRAKDTAMEDYYVQKRISDRFWLKRIRVTLASMGATFASTLVNNITTYKPMINDAQTYFTMDRSTTAALPDTIPVAACGPVANAIDAGTCKTAYALFSKLGMLSYQENAVANLANMFENNAWEKTTIGAQAKKSIMDVFIYTKTTTGGSTAFDATATTGETTIYADAWAYAKKFNALTGSTNDWRTLGKDTFAKYKLYKVELTWSATGIGSGGATQNYAAGDGSGAVTNGLKETGSNGVMTKTKVANGGSGFSASANACYEGCAKLQTVKYAVATDGTVTPSTLLLTGIDADNNGLSAGSELYCHGAVFSTANSNECYFYSKGLAAVDSGQTIANGAKPMIRVTTNAVQFITKLKLSKKGAASDKWAEWYDTGATKGMGAYLAKYKLFEDSNFLWQLDQESYSEDLATYIKTVGSSGIYEPVTKVKYLAYHGAFNNDNGLGTRVAPTIKTDVDTSSNCKSSIGKADYPNAASTCLDTVNATGGQTTFSDATANIYIPKISVTFGANYGNAAKNVSPMISLAESGSQGGTAYAAWKKEVDSLAYKRATWLDGMAAPETYAMPFYGAGAVPTAGGANYVKWYALTNGYTKYKAAKEEYDAQSNIVLQAKDDVVAASAVWTAASNAASASVAGGSAKVLADATALRTTATTGLKAKMDAAVKSYKDYYMATSVGVYGTAGQGTAYKATQDAGAGGATAASLAGTINALRSAATGKWSALKTAELNVSKFLETCFLANGTAKPAGCVIGGYAAAVNDVAVKTAKVALEETKCKNSQWDAYKATLVSAQSTRKSNMTTIKTLIDDEDVKRAAVKPGATGSRCEKPTSNGDLKSRGAKPCSTETDCCGAATGKLVDTGAAAQVSADSNMATMTIEVCQPSTDTKYKYRPPRMPMATTFPATVEWDFKCIGDARRIAAMATFAAASLFMMQ